MTDLQLAHQAAHILDEAKAEDILILDVAKLLLVVDYFVLGTCINSRHAKSCAGRLYGELKKEHILPSGQEGMHDASWVLMDYQSVVIHLFLEDTRRFYDLEHLWSDAPVMPWRKAKIAEGPPVTQ